MPGRLRRAALRCAAADGRMKALHLHADAGSCRGRLGMGHLLISCSSCHDKLRRTTFYESPHDIRHRQARSVAGVQTRGHRHRGHLTGE
jgi:hypothetical protein